MKLLSQLSDEVNRCNRCGFCQEVCPTYAVTGEEVSVARGRNRLLRMVVEGHLSLEGEAELRTHLYSCLLCGACAVACPPGVQTDKLVLAARLELARSRGLSAAQRFLLRGTLGASRRVLLPTKLLGLYQRSGVRWLVRRVGLLGLFQALGHLDGLLPAVPERSFRAELGRGSRTLPEPRRKPRRRVSYFLGCVTDSLFPVVARATVAVLERNGYEVLVLDNACCGAPHVSYGDAETVVQLVRRNVARLREADPEVIVSDCATCLSSLRQWPELVGEEDARLADLARDMAGRARDVSQLLLDDGLEAPRGAVEKVVTFHDPCHLARGLGVRSEPRTLLRAIPGVTYRELPEADRCCGGAGSYTVTHRHVSLAILERKIDAFKVTGADTLATSCPSCLVQLGLGLKRAKVEARVAHPLQLLWQSYEASWNVMRS